MPTESSTRPEDLTDAQIDELIAHPYWESLGPGIDALASEIPQATERAERTSLLTWIYAQQGVATFDELSQRLTGMANLPKRKKHLRQALRAMEKLFLVNIVNFPGDDADAPGPDEDVVGKSSLISLTWTGMLWLKRAWAARERLSRHRSIALVHQELIEEEEEAGWADPYWVENVSSVDPDDSRRRVERVMEAFPTITSIFDLAGKKSSR